MPGSPTTPGRPGARDDAPVRVAFRLRNSVGTRDMNLSRLNGWPMRSPADASPPPSRTTTARLGADVDRYSFMRRTCTVYSLPVSRRTAKDSGHYRTTLSKSANHCQIRKRTIIRHCTGFKCVLCHPRDRRSRHGSTAQAGTVPLVHIIRSRSASTSILADLSGVLKYD